MIYRQKISDRILSIDKTSLLMNFIYEKIYRQFLPMNLSTYLIHH